ncbi:MAG: hypothetical protein FJ119_08945 [Deltaproteobacteria bacterium]|nr:hypothetical protein [Deltaproteobacteria bacterium]
MNIRYINVAAAVCVVIALSCSGSAAAGKAPTQEPEVVVTVNGTQITRAEIDADIAQKLAGAADKMPPEQLEQIKTRMQEKAVDHFITKTVLSAECDKNKINVTPEDIDKALAEMTKTLPEGMKLEDALKSSGMTLESLKKDIAFGLRVNKLIDANVKQPAEPTEAELKQFYEQNASSFEVKESAQARHILITTSKDDDEKVLAEKRARIEKIRAQLVEGADFEKIAAENSDCPSKSRGGSLGSFERGRMVKPFEDAAFSQEIMAIGPVVETQFGYHVIQVQGRTPASKRPFEEVKDQIKEHPEQTGKNTAVRAYIEGLKSKATIVYGKK